MSAFDPYREWLDLPDGPRPPDHYDLLGLKRFEQDFDTIRGAAAERKSTVRRVRPGPHAAAWQKLLDEIDAARNCLLDESAKQAYDGQLRGPPPGDESVFEDREGETPSAAESSLVAGSEESYIARAASLNPMPPPLGKAKDVGGPPKRPDVAPVESLTKNPLPPSLATPTTGASKSTSGIAKPAPAADTTAKPPPPADKKEGASVPRKPPRPPAKAPADGDPPAGVPTATKQKKKRSKITLPPAGGEEQSSSTSSLPMQHLLPRMPEPSVAADTTKPAATDRPPAPAASPRAPTPSRPTTTADTSEPTGAGPAVASPMTADVDAQAAEQEFSTAAPVVVTRSPTARWKRKNSVMVPLLLMVNIAVLAYIAYSVTHNGSFKRDQHDSNKQVAVNVKEESQKQQHRLNGNVKPDRSGAADKVAAGNSATNRPETNFSSRPDRSMPPKRGVSPQNQRSVVDPRPVVDRVLEVKPSPEVDPGPKEAWWTPGAALDPSDNIRPAEGDSTDWQQSPGYTVWQQTPGRIEPNRPPGRTETNRTTVGPIRSQPPKLTEAQLSELAAALEEVKRSLAARDLDAAARRMDHAKAIASKAPGPHADKVERMSLLCDYVHEFWDAVKKGLVRLDDQELKVENTRLHVVEANERGIVYRYRGKNHRFGIYEMPPGLARLVAERWLEKTPTSRIFVGAFMAVEPKYGPTKAREQWDAALRGGAPVAELIPILDEL